MGAVNNMCVSTSHNAAHAAGLKHWPSPTPTWLFACYLKYLYKLKHLTGWPGEEMEAISENCSPTHDSITWQQQLWIHAQRERERDIPSHSKLKTEGKLSLLPSILLYGHVEGTLWIIIHNFVFPTFITAVGEHRTNHVANYLIKKHVLLFIRYDLL